MSDPRSLTDSLLAAAALPPGPIVPSPYLVDRYFSMCEQLYTQGVTSVYVPAVLEDHGGVLKLAARDAASIRHSMRDDGWVIDSRNLVRERHEAANRWVVHEAAMRSAIAAGAEVDTVIRDYFERTVHTDPDDYATLKAKITTGYPSYLEGWQEELEATKSRVRTVISAPTDMPVGLTVMSVRGLAAGLPDTVEGWDEFYAASAKVDAGVGVLADVAAARGGGSGTADPPSAGPRRSPRLPAPHEASMGGPPPARTAAPPDVGNVFDVRGNPDGGWTAGIDQQARGIAIAEPPPALTPVAGAHQTLSADGLAEAVRPVTGRQLEHQMAETDARLREAPTPVAFSLGGMVKTVKNGTTFTGIVGHLRRARKQLMAAGQPDPFPTALDKAHVDGILSQDTIGFIFADPRLKAEWTRLTLAIDGVTSPIVRNSREYLALPVAYRRLGPDAQQTLKGEFQRFFAGKVGKRKPDMIDFWLDGRRPLVLSDASANVNRLFHNFKSRFYAAVLQKITGLPVEAFEESRAERKQLQ